MIKPLWTTQLPTAAGPGGETASAGGGTAIGGEGTAAGSALVSTRPAVGHLTPFRLGERFGYVDEAGTLHYLDSIRYGLALADTRFVNFDRNAPSLTVRGVSGEPLADIEQDGYPTYLGDRLFVISSDQAALVAFDADGKRLWQVKTGSIITAAAAGARTAVVGLLDGEIEAIDEQGRVLFRDRPAGSSVSVIFGIAVSSSEDHIAVISGLDPQILTIYERSGGQYVATQTRRLATDFRRPVLVRPLGGPVRGPLRRADGFVFEGADGVAVYSPQSRRLATVALAGSLETVLSERVQGMSVAGAVAEGAGRDGSGEAETLFFLPEGRPVLRFRFAGGVLTLRADGTRILWGIDDTIFETEVTTG